MKKRLTIDELQKGRLYSDAEGVETLQYIGGYGAGDLSEFVEMQYNDDLQDFEPSENRIILTPLELTHYHEL